MCFKWMYLETYNINPNNVFQSQIIFSIKAFFFILFFFQNGNSFKKLVSICKVFINFLLFSAKISFREFKNFVFKLRLPLEESLDFVLRS